jgi:hypothetical protein
MTLGICMGRAQNIHNLIAMDAKVTSSTDDMKQEP